MYYIKLAYDFYHLRNVGKVSQGPLFRIQDICSYQVLATRNLQIRKKAKYFLGAEILVFSKVN